MIAPENFDLARKAWARQFLQDYETQGPAAAQKQLTQLLREDNGVSQLGLMFPSHEYPGVVDQFRTMAAEYRSAPGRAQATSARAAQMKEGVAETTAIGAEAVERTMEAGQRTVATAQERLDAATRKATDVREALENMKTQGELVTETTRKAQALSLKRAQDEMKTAQTAFDTAKKKARVSDEAPFVSRAMHRGIVGGSPLAFLIGLAHATPVAPVLMGLGAAGTIYEGGRLALPAIARTQTGERLMREGLRGQYGTQAARWVAQVLGGSAGDVVPEDEQK
jgi:hypothetical protein